MRRFPTRFPPPALILRPFMDAWKEEPPRWWEVRWMTRFICEILILIALSSFVAGILSKGSLLEAKLLVLEQRFDYSDRERGMAYQHVLQELAYIRGRQTDFNRSQIRLLDESHHAITSQLKRETRQTNQILQNTRRIRRVTKTLSQIERSLHHYLHRLPPYSHPHP